MSKKLVKKAGRKPIDINKYFTKIQPYLSIGMSLHRSCVSAQIPYSTVIDHYNKDDHFRLEVDSLKDDTNVIARTRLANRVGSRKYDGRAIEYWLSNLDEE